MSGNGRAGGRGVALAFRAGGAALRRGDAEPRRQRPYRICDARLVVRRAGTAPLAPMFCLQRDCFGERRMRVMIILALGALGLAGCAERSASYPPPYSSPYSYSDTGYYGSTAA